MKTWSSQRRHDGSQERILALVPVRECCKEERSWKAIREIVARRVPRPANFSGWGKGFKTEPECNFMGMVHCVNE